jgi:lysosomal alpha-mannosidase
LDAVENNITATKKRVLHIIPHSHTDIGWLNTPEQSFSGFAEESNNSSPYTGGVKDILDSVYEQLVKNDTRTFTYAETKFFKMWFENQTAEV